MLATFAAMQVIRYARTRHLTITTQVSRFVYLLHTAPTSPRAPLLRNVQQPPDDAAAINTRPGRTSGDQTSGGQMILDLIEAIRIIWALIRFWVI